MKTFFFTKWLISGRLSEYITNTAAQIILQDERDADGHHAFSEAAEERPRVKQLPVLPGTGLRGLVGGGKLGVQDSGGELGLPMLSIYTCRAEHQGLEDV